MPLGNWEGASLREGMPPTRSARIRAPSLPWKHGVCSFADFRSIVQIGAWAPLDWGRGVSAGCKARIFVGLFRHFAEIIVVYHSGKEEL